MTLSIEETKKNIDGVRGVDIIITANTCTERLLLNNPHTMTAIICPNGDGVNQIEIRITPKINK